MNCIFYCIFNDEKYIDVFYLFLESIFIYGNLDDNTHIWVYTSTEFMNIIKESHLFNDEKVKFEINNNNEIFDFYNLKFISKYDKILYLGNNILIKDDINKVFDICKDDFLYYLEEDETNVFTSGILLFNNCEKIKGLFENNTYFFNEQLFITYNFSKSHLYDNKILKSLVLNSNNNIPNDDKVIYQYTIGTTLYESKIINMTIFLNNIKDYSISNNINKAKKYINDYLMPIIISSGDLLEGNIFMSHNTTTYTDCFLNKTKNISNLLLNKNIKNVMEIGFNAGFSTLLMLLTNPTMNITCFDLGEHKYTLPCYEKLKETFGDRINIIIGDSIETLKNINDVYDLIHIDGGHTTKVASSDTYHSIRLSKKGTILIMDDYDADNLYKLWNWCIKKYNLKELNINVYKSQHHNIKYLL